MLPRISQKTVAFILFAVLVSYLIINSHLQRLGAQRRIVKPSLGNSTAQPQCKVPILPLDDVDIMKHIKYFEPIKCTDESGHHFEDWVVVNGTHAVLTDAAKTKFGLVDCWFSEITRIDDGKVNISKVPIHGDVYAFKESDFVYVSCNASTQTQWNSFLACPRSNIVTPKPVSQPSTSQSKTEYSYGETKSNEGKRLLNVVMWGHDSLSRNMFMRKLPISFSYLTNELEGIILKGYNIVGDGTPQALTPMLTGKTELELPEVRKRMPNASYVNVYPFVWNDYKAKGYLTGSMEDSPSIGTYQYRLRGFREMPTDFYFRPFFIAAEPHYSKFLKYCIGSVPRHKIMMNYVKHILNYKKEIPKFIFSLHSELSHGAINEIQGADQDLVSFLEELKQSGSLNNTILIIFSDHGARFSKIRATQQGKQEERMPMYMFVFPSWFKSVYPVAYKNFQRNSDILSTPFDIHATLHDILRLPSLSEDYFSAQNSIKQRELSLFRPVPIERDCQAAFIEPHWCACLNWQPLDASSQVVLKAAEEFAAYLNRLMANHTELCAPLKINKILSATSLVPSQELIRFKKNADMDGFVPDMSDTMSVTVSTMQLTVETVPGFGLFEVSLRHDLVTNTFILHESEISRVNKYGSQSACIEHTLMLLRKYCYCRDNGTGIKSS